MADKTTPVNSHEDSASKARKASSRGGLEGAVATTSHMDGAPGIIARASANLAMVSPAELRILQQTIGNQAVGRLLRQGSVDPNASSNTGILRRQVIQRDDDGEDDGLGFQVAIPGVGAIAVNVSGSGGSLSAAVPGVGAVTLSGSTTADGGIAVTGAGTAGSSSGSFGVAESDGQFSGSAQVKTPDAAGTLSGSANGDGFAATGAGQVGGSSGVFAASEGNGETGGSISVITPNGSGSAQGTVDQDGHVSGSGSLTTGQARVDGGPEIADATRAREVEEVADPTAPVTIIPPVLRQGASGAETQHVQNQLNNHGTSPPLTVDGAFGPKTRQAVITFQADNGLDADGVVGKRTWAKLLA